MRGDLLVLGRRAGPDVRHGRGAVAAAAGRGPVDVSKPKGAAGLKQLATYVPKDVDDKLAERAKAEKKTKREVVTAALSATLERGEQRRTRTELPSADGCSPTDPSHRRTLAVGGRRFGAGESGSSHAASIRGPPADARPPAQIPERSPCRSCERETPRCP